jgi:enoyl-CoA hydratase/carnithine racemase
VVIASPTATFGLTEVKRGLYAAAGGLPRLVRALGMHKASELALTGRTLKAEQLQQLGFLTVAASPDSLIDEAVQLATEIASQSPDAVIVTRAALRDAWESASVERSSQLIEGRYKKDLLQGENLQIGLRAFAQKKQPKFIPSKF